LTEESYPVLTEKICLNIAEDNYSNIERRDLFFIYNLFTQRKDKYNADTSLQDRRQEKNMIDWL
jgi:hypothetical protein